ncbi:MULTISPECIES: phage protein NinX family protein [Burkholderia]|uniref:DUF2591 domain-containing protein n=1 Tax=Burkholderia aenigmatica TaxID=2015348 RepID=A0A6J5JKD6_9BURK|nr:MULTISPECIES: phage protein NinX family protein [Burkholderia]CAB3972314.1 hypothetical protein BLA3211_06906 [Burkholderia aenigmatica]
MKVSELEGVQLDYWTARADGCAAKIMQPGERLNGVLLDKPTCVALTHGYTDWWQPFHVYWGSAGPIIEREKISITIADYGKAWGACMPKAGGMPLSIGPTPLIAAMRAFVASKLGEEVPTP